MNPKKASDALNDAELAAAILAGIVRTLEKVPKHRHVNVIRELRELLRDETNEPQN